MLPLLATQGHDLEYYLIIIALIIAIVGGLIWIFIHVR